MFNINARAAFEQSLIDNNITWFVYIKFDKSNNPLVVGKTGSLLVNSSGSDLSFSMNIEDGPARRYLLENNKEWDKTKILIIPVETEENAYELEDQLQKEYNLFGS